MREIAAPPASFTTTVMTHVGREKWQTERVIDLGFNLAMAAGLAVIVAGAAGLAWSLGFLTITIDTDTIVQLLNREAAGRVLSQVQTIAMSAVLLTMALGVVVVGGSGHRLDDRLDTDSRIARPETFASVSNLCLICGVLNLWP